MALTRWADDLEREQRPLPTVPGWYPTIVVERGGESCTGALLADDDGWRTAREVDGRYGHWIEGTPSLTIHWAEQHGTTPGQTLYEVWTKPYGFFPWSGISSAVRDRYERAAKAVIARLRSTHSEAEAARGRSKRKPMVWKVGEPAPAAYVRVRDKHGRVWVWHNNHPDYGSMWRTSDGRVKGTWTWLCEHRGPLTEVLP